MVIRKDWSLTPSSLSLRKEVSSDQAETPKSPPAGTSKPAEAPKKAEPEAKSEEAADSKKTNKP